MEIRIYDKDGIKDFAPFDLQVFIDYLQWQQKKKAVDYGGLANGVLSEAFRKAMHYQNKEGKPLDFATKLEI